MIVSTPSLKSALDYLESLDFEYIIQLMTSPDYFLPIWSREEALFCRMLYKRFIILNKKYPNAILIPTPSIDEFWHNHILHTKAYHQDCQAIFGYYRHHTPSSNTLEEKNFLRDSFKNTQQLYFLEFNENL